MFVRKNILKVFCIVQLRSVSFSQGGYDIIRILNLGDLQRWGSCRGLSCEFLISRFATLFKTLNNIVTLISFQFHISVQTSL